MQFLVLMVPRCRNVKVTEHIVRCALRLRIATLGGDVFDQLSEQAQRPLHPLMAAEASQTVHRSSLPEH